MKNWTLAVKMIVLALLVLIPCGIRAEIPPCPVDTPRAKEIWANAPQTPEALLTVLKEFMDNPKMNGFEFYEKAFGLAREEWGEPSLDTKNGPHGGRLIRYVPFLAGAGQDSLPHKWIHPPAPYTGDGSIELDENNNLRSLSISGFDKGFCVTPPLVRKILGEPERVVRGRDGLTLIYAWKYWMRINFYKKGHTNAPIENSRERLFDAQVIDEEFRILKDVCSVGIGISRQKN